MHCEMFGGCTPLLPCLTTHLITITCGTGSAYPFGAPEFIPGFWWDSCYSIFSFMCIFCSSLFILFSFGHCIVCPSSIYGFWLTLSTKLQKRGKIISPKTRNRNLHIVNAIEWTTYWLISKIDRQRANQPVDKSNWTLIVFKEGFQFRTNINFIEYQESFCYVLLKKVSYFTID